MRTALDELLAYVLTHSGEMSANRPALRRLINDVALELDEHKALLEKERDFSLECGLDLAKLQAEFDAYRLEHPDKPQADIDAERIEAELDARHDQQKDGDFLGHNEPSWTLNSKLDGGV